MEDETLELALKTIQQGKQALVFAPSRASAEKTAEDISEKTRIFLPELGQQVLKGGVSTPTKQCRRLSNCVKKGIAFHHAGLTQKQKEIIEDEFKKGTVKIICCTPTLAMGISVPAFRVIIKSLKRYSGAWGMDWIPVLEYMQMAGRAGRPEFQDSHGEAIVIAKHEGDKSEIYERYICGVPEEIYSKLAVEPVFRTYLLSLIATRIVNSEKEIVDFFSKTFWAYQFKDPARLKLIIDKMLNWLEEKEFVIRGEKRAEFMRADGLNQEGGFVKATLIGQRISQLYLDPYTADHLISCLKRWVFHQSETGGIPACSRTTRGTEEFAGLLPAIPPTCDKRFLTKSSSSKGAFSFLQMIGNTLEMRPLLRIKTKEVDWIQEELVKRYELLLQPEPNLYDPNYDDFMNSIKTALFFGEWIEEQNEDFLLEKYGISPGEIFGKLEIADWLLYSSSELAKLLQFQDLLKELSKLRVRLKYGAKEELLPLLKLKWVGRKRARKLFDNKIRDLRELNKTSLGVLSQLVGDKTAVAIKEQLDTPIEEVPEGRRKGQLSIGKFGGE